MPTEDFELAITCIKNNLLIEFQALLSKNHNLINETDLSWCLLDYAVDYCNTNTFATFLSIIVKLLETPQAIQVYLTKFANTALQHAAKQAKVEIANALLDLYPQNEKQEKAQKLLPYIAIYNCSETIIKFCEISGAQLKYQDNYGNNILHNIVEITKEDTKAWQKVNPITITWLVSSGIDPVQKNLEKDTPLAKLLEDEPQPDLISLHDLEYVAAFYSPNAHASQTATVMVACLYNIWQEIRSLRAVLKIDTEAEQPKQNIDAINNVEISLELAAKQGQLKIISDLLFSYPQEEQVEEYQKLLPYVAAYNNPKVVEEFCKMSGAKLNYRYPDYNNLLHCIVQITNESREARQQVKPNTIIWLIKEQIIDPWQENDDGVIPFELLLEINSDALDSLLDIEFVTAFYLHAMGAIIVVSAKCIYELCQKLNQLKAVELSEPTERPKRLRDDESSIEDDEEIVLPSAKRLATEAIVKANTSSITNAASSAAVATTTVPNRYWHFVNVTAESLESESSDESMINDSHSPKPK